MRKSCLIVCAAAAWLLALSPISTSGQILFSAGAYTNNFDSLGSASANWTNNLTLPGWYASKGNGDATNYIASAGTGTAGGIYSFGVNGTHGLSDRALGSLAGSSTTYAFGVRFVNDTVSAQSNITISCTGEQWRSGSSNTPQTLAFSWQVAATPITNTYSVGGWANFPALNVVSPNLSAITNALDGNAATNRLILSSSVLTGVVVNPGQELFLRWQDVDDGGFDNALAIDDLTVTFDAVSSVPEPPPGSSNTISLLTYNVKGNGALDWSTNAAQVQAIGRQMQYLNPDIITFQEIPYDLSYQMTNFVNVYLPGYSLARNSGTDGSIRSVIASRFPITRSTSWLDGIDLRSFGYSNANNNLDNFTRDLFEAVVAVPGFPRPLHVFTTHLKSTSGTTYADAAAKRAAEAAAITNFFATNLFVLYPFDPYMLSGDMNDADTNALALQRLVSPPTGLKLTNPKNPVTGSINTFSIQGTLNERLDFIFPNGFLYSNIKTSLVFRSDKVVPLPTNLYSNDSRTASDHLPVMMLFNNPYDKPFRITSLMWSNASVALQWESVFGQPYRVDSSSNLGAWSVLASNLTATSNAFTLVTNVTGETRYFRIYRVP